MRERIMRAAAEEMRVRSIKFTMHDLARRLGVSKRCIYEQFASKEEIIAAIVDSTLEEIRQRRRITASDDNLSYMEKLFRIMAPCDNLYLPMEGRIAEDMMRLLPSEWAKIEGFKEKEWSFLRDFFQLGIENGHLRPASLPIIKILLHGSNKDIFDYNFLVQNNITLQEAFSHITDIILYGLVARDIKPSTTSH